MSWLSNYTRSSIGAKQVMAITGLGMVLFALIHMLGHLQMFGGQDMYNAYAHFLQNLTEVKWPARIGLIGIFILHIAMAIRVYAINKAARPVAYAVFKTVRSTAMGRYMSMTGLVLLAFIVFHLLHFTIGTVQPDHFHQLDTKGRYDAYSMYIYGFKNGGLFAAYAVAMALLSMHLGHGASSWAQTLGLRHPKYSPMLDKLGPAISILLFVGYMAPPTAVILGVIKLPGA